MPTLLDYCNEHIDALREYKQANFKWAKYNIEPFNQIPQFVAVLGLIPNKIISRHDIIQTFKDEKYYLGFVMAMMWGNISMKPKKGHKEDKTTSNAYKALNMHHVTITDYLLKVKQLIEIEEYEEAYNGFLTGGQFKIDGVDESFFTKILCFLSQSLKKPRNLLIYDKWTRRVHLHLMLDNKFNPNVFYTNNSIKNIATKGTIYPRNNQEYHAYHHYCHSMSKLADALSNIDYPISPFHLESYLFGKSLKLVDNKNNHNPRFWYKNNFIHQYLPRFR